MFKITIIIPITNNKKYSHESFDSLLNQTIGFDNLQIIFVGSSKPYDFDAKYDNVLHIETNAPENLEGKLLNTGMKHAISDYLMFLNPSDILKEDACELLYDTIINEESDIASGVQKANSENSNHILDFESIGENPGLFGDWGISDKLFKKSFLNANAIKFKENIYNPQPVFLLDALSNSTIHCFNKEITVKRQKPKMEFTGKMLKGILDSCFEMYYIFNSKNKTKIFVENILYSKLNGFLEYSNEKILPVTDFIKLLNYSKALFNSCIQNNKSNELFECISQDKFEPVICSVYGREIPKQNEIRIATFDLDAYNSFRYDCDMLKLNLEGWEREIQSFKPQIFMATSQFLKDSNEDLVEVSLKYCLDNNIQTVFIENEDLEFSELSLKFDYIFTNFKGNIPKYCQKGHENVHHLMFAVQPKVFNPINNTPRLKNSIMYHGVWNDENPEYCELMSKTFNQMIVNSYKLKIYDENNLTSLDNTNYPYMFNYYLDTLNDESQVPSLYKRFERGLIINENDYLTSGKILEFMISNTAVFSNFSKETFNLFGNNVYYFDYDNDNFNDENLEKIKNENVHNVLENHTYSNRLKEIIDTVDLNYIPSMNHILLFYELNDLDELNEIYNHFYSINYPYKEMKIITSEEYLYLPDTILKSQLNDIELDEDDYFSFIDFNFDFDFINEALLHFKYIDKSIGIKEEVKYKFTFAKTVNTKNAIFHSSNYKRVISNENRTFDIYRINNFKIKVSIIIPVFNVEEYIEECLDSVINQTFKDIEIICINDGSYDSSLDILKRYGDRDPRIKIITQFNKGPGGARNTGLDIAQGEYIYFIDSDDIIKRNGIREMYQQVNFKNLDMLKFNLMTFEDETHKNKALYQRVKPAFLKELGDVIFDSETIGSDVFTLSPNMQSSFFKREAVKDIRFPEKLIFEDNLYLIEALLNSKRIYYYDKFLSNKRERKDSITKSTGRDFPDILEIRNQIVDLAKKYDFYEDYKFTIYSRKYMFIKLLFLQTEEIYKKKFFEKIRQDCINKKDEYEREGIFDILDEKSIKIFNAGLNSKDYKEFEELIRNA